MSARARTIKPAREPLSGLSSVFSRHPFIFLGLSLLIFITIILVITALSLTHGVEVEVLYTPTSATFTIDGKEYQNGTYNLPAGEHRIHIEKSGFITQDFTFDTNKSRKLFAYLLQEDGSYSWYIDHVEDALILDSLGSKTATEAMDTYAEKHSVMEKLPLIYSDYAGEDYIEYRIDGGSFTGCSSDFCLQVTDSTGGNYNAALDLLRSAGISPENYEILYHYTPILPLD